MNHHHLIAFHHMKHVEQREGKVIAQLPSLVSLTQQRPQGSEKKERELLVSVGFLSFFNCWGGLAEVTVWDSSV